jgi:hypothetical protein
VKQRALVNDPFMITKLKERAKSRATQTKAGVATYDEVGVVWYPVCGRFTWFDETGPITKALAVKLLRHRWK